MSVRNIIPVILCLTVAGEAWCAPYGVYDTESQARGGAGVATSTRTTVFGNPALMITVRPTKEMTVIFPSASILTEDPDDLLDTLDQFQAAVAGGNDAQARSLLTALDGRWAIKQHHTAGAFVLGEVEGSAAIHIKNYSVVGARVNADPGDLTASPPYNSTLQVQGINVIEAGVSFSEKMRFRILRDLGELVVGLTPKAMIGKIYERNDPLTSATLDTSYGEGRSSGAVTMDLGIAQTFGNVWAWGVTVQNLIPSKIKGDVITAKMGPQARVGATYFFDKGSISGDIDLTNNSPIGFMKRSQVIAIGGDYQLLNWLTLRAGFGENINDSESGTATFGIGMRWDIFRLDMTAMAGSSTRGLSLQMTTEL